jgi:hypothetical protein
MVRLPCCALLFMHGPVASHWLCEDAVAHWYSVEVVGRKVIGGSTTGVAMLGAGVVGLNVLGKSDGDGVAGVAFAVGLKVIGGSTTGVAMLGAGVVGLNVLGKSGVVDGGGVGTSVGAAVVGKVHACNSSRVAGHKAPLPSCCNRTERTRLLMWLEPSQGVQGSQMLTTQSTGQTSKLHSWKPSLSGHSLPPP